MRTHSRLRTWCCAMLAALTAVTTVLTPEEPSQAAGEPTRQSFQQMSDIQSGRWQPGNWHAIELMVTNQTSASFELVPELTYVSGSGMWHKQAPRTLAPGASFSVQSEDRYAAGFIGHHMQVTYRMAGSNELFLASAENPATGRNKYWVHETRRYAAAVDGWNNMWIPERHGTATVASDVIGKSNWSVVAVGIGDTAKGAAESLPTGEWSSSSCTAYEDILEDLGIPIDSGAWSDAWRDGSVGAAAGALLGWLSAGCSSFDTPPSPAVSDGASTQSAAKASWFGSPRWEASFGERGSSAGCDAPGTETMMVGRRHSGDENGQTAHQCAVFRYVGRPVSRDPELIDALPLIAREESNNELILCPTNKVMVHRAHVDDENGSTWYWCNALKGDNGYDGRAEIGLAQWHPGIKESGSSFTCPTDELLVGRIHRGDENGTTWYACAGVVIPNPN